MALRPRYMAAIAAVDKELADLEANTRAWMGVDLWDASSPAERESAKQHCKWRMERAKDILKQCLKDYTRHLPCSKKLFDEDDGGDERSDLLWLPVYTGHPLP